MKGQNHDPLYPKTTDKSVIMQPQERIIFDCKVDLAGLPDEEYGVVVRDQNGKKMQEVRHNGTLQENQFRVDYTHGYLYFHASREREQITIEKFYSRGLLYFPASRVYSIDECGRIDIEKTLQYFIDIIKTWRFKGDYEPETVYGINNIVFYDGSTYLSLQNINHGNFPKDAPEWWRELACGFVYKGEYQEGKTYYPREIVSYQYGLYGCIEKTDSALPEDSVYWQQIVSVDRIFEEWEGTDGNGGLKQEINKAAEQAQQAAADTVQAKNEIVETWQGADGNGGIKKEAQDAIQDAAAAMEEMNQWSFLGVYDPVRTYQRHNSVFYQGSVYVALQDGFKAKQPNEEEAFWHEMACGFHYRGRYDENDTYYPRDLVSGTANDSLYLCKQTCGAVPLENEVHWQLLIDVAQFITSADAEDLYARKQNESGGFVGGSKAAATNGGAIGADAKADSGGAAGSAAWTRFGGAAGSGSHSYDGGAVGGGAKTGDGFAGGKYARAVNEQNGSGIDAIQLGTGNNYTEKTLQVYDHQLMDKDGMIPNERISSQPAEKIIQDSTHRFTTDAEKTSWNNKLNAGNIKAGSNVTVTANGNDVTISSLGGENAANGVIDIDATYGVPGHATVLDSLKDPAEHIPLFKRDGSTVTNAAEAESGIYRFNFRMPDNEYQYCTLIQNTTTIPTVTLAHSVVAIGEKWYCRRAADEQDFYSWTEMNSGEQVPVVDNLTSTSTTSALSANQGKVLKEAIDNKAEKSNFYGGFEAGTDSSGGDGGAIGLDAHSSGGFAGGVKSYTSTGGAVGMEAKSGDGFAGGTRAKTINSSGNVIDAVQLGTGTNSVPKSLQVYGHQLMDANGKIPAERLPAGAGGSGKNYATIVIGTTSSGHTESQVDYLCNGSADEEEINAAIASLTDGGKIVLLDGVYSIDTSISFNNCADITLEGSGYTVLIRDLSARTEAGILQVNNVGTNKTQNIVVRNLVIDGNKQYMGNSSLNVSLLLNHNVQDCQFRDLVFQNCATPVIKTVGDVQFNLFKNIVIEGENSSTEVLFSTGFNYNKIKNLKATTFEMPESSDIYNNLFSQCIIGDFIIRGYKNTVKQLDCVLLEIYGDNNLIVHTNISVGIAFGTPGIFVTGSGNLITDNRILEINSTDPISITGDSNTVSNNNLFCAYYSDCNGIIISGKYNTVTDNTIYNYGAGISIYNSSHTLVNGNMVAVTTNDIYPYSGIGVIDSAKTLITGNLVRQFDPSKEESYSIRISNSQDCFIANNMLTANPVILDASPGTEIESNKII